MAILLRYPRALAMAGGQRNGDAPAAQLRMPGVESSAGWTEALLDGAVGAFQVLDKALDVIEEQVQAQLSSDWLPTVRGEASAGTSPSSSSTSALATATAPSLSSADQKAPSTDLPNAASSAAVATTCTASQSTSSTSVKPEKQQETAQASGWEMAEWVSSIAFADAFSADSAPREATRQACRSEADFLRLLIELEQRLPELPALLLHDSSGVAGGSDESTKSSFLSASVVGAESSIQPPAMRVPPAMPHWLVRHPRATWKASSSSECGQTQLVEVIREAVEALVWGERHDGAFFDLFCEHRMLARFVGALQSLEAPRKVTLQLLQALLILVQNTCKETSFYTLLSGGVLNALFSDPPDLSDEEALNYFVVLLKALVLRLDAASAWLCLVPSRRGEVWRLPVFERAALYAGHWDPMVRTAARSTVLGLLNLEDPQVRAAASHAFRRYLAPQLAEAVRRSVDATTRRRGAATVVVAAAEAAATAGARETGIPLPPLACDSDGGQRLEAEQEQQEEGHDHGGEEVDGLCGFVADLLALGTPGVRSALRLHLDESHMDWLASACCPSAT